MATLQLKSLTELCDAIVDCEHKTAPLVDSGIPSIRTTDICNGRLDIQNANRVSEDTYRLWTARLEPRPQDIILAREAPVGEVGIIPENTRVCLGQRTVLIRPCKDKIVPRYLLFLMTSAEIRHALRSRSEGSTVSHLNVADIRSLPITVRHDIKQQERIADILGSLDDKIELNRKMNETLETMARAVFKSWFVDFDPVVAKSQGLQPEGMDAETAKLFPDSFEDSEIGRIPNGWEVKPFSETVDVLSGGTPKTTETAFWGGDIPWFSVVDAPNESDVFVIATEKTITPAGVDGSATQVLPLGTTIISARGTVGKVCLTGVPTAMNQSCYGLRGKTGSNGSFTYFSTRFLVSTLQNHAHGSVFDTITRNTFDVVCVVVPPKKIVEIFENIVKPWLERIHNNLLEQRALASIRDALLPRLLSGELWADVRGGLYE